MKLLPRFLAAFVVRLETMSQVLLILINIVFVAVLGLIDYWVGYEISFSIFYLFPIMLIAWFVGMRMAFLFCVLSAVLWFLADMLAGVVYSHILIAYWNALVRFTFFVVAAYLISTVKKRLEYEVQLSRKDSLTGVANARAFYESVEQEILRSKRYAHGFSLVYLDLDDFKAINDTNGHDVGDGFLVKVAQMIKKNIRMVDLVARLGGDEFAVLLPEAKADDISTVLERIDHGLQDVAREYASSTTCSAGIVTVSGQVSSAKEVIAMADELMYEAKRSGKNTVKQRVL